MRRLLLLATAGTLAALALTAPASAKGPSTASLTGPGLGRALPITGKGENGPGTPLGSLVQYGGFFPQVFTQSPDPVVWSRPKGDLGPRYRITYRVPGGNGKASTIVQDVYPYAKPNLVTYMRPAQRFWGGQRTHGGWYVAYPGLKAALVAAGLPQSLPSPDGSFPWAWTAAGVAAFVLLLAFALRRRDVARFRMVKSPA